MIKLLFIHHMQAAKDLLVLSNYDNLNSTVKLYDLTGRKRITVQPLGGEYYALVPNNGIAPHSIRQPE